MIQPTVTRGAGGISGLVVGGQWFWMTGCLYRVLRDAGRAVFESWRGPLRLPYLWIGRCSPLMGLGGWGGGGCSSSWARREKWSDGMWGWGQPIMLLSISQWLSSGPSRPSTLMCVREKKM